MLHGPDPFFSVIQETFVSASALQISGSGFSTIKAQKQSKFNQFVSRKDAICVK
jgi:hypothetical protein